MKNWQNKDEILAEAQKLFIAKDFDRSLRFYERVVANASADWSGDDDEDNSEYDLVLSEQAYVKGRYYFRKQRYYLSHLNMANARLFDNKLNKVTFFRFTPKPLSPHDFMFNADMYGRRALGKYNALPLPVLTSDLHSLTPEENKQNLISVLNERDIVECVVTKHQTNNKQMSKVYLLDSLVWHIYHVNPSLEFTAW